MDLYNDTFDKFCDLVEKRGADILDIATGPGNVAKYLYCKKNITMFIFRHSSTAISMQA